MSVTGERDSFVGGHIRPQVKQSLDDDADHLDLSRSKLLDMILADWYGIEEIPLEFDSR